MEPEISPESLRQGFSHQELRAAAAAYMGTFFGAVPREEPARSHWYERYGMLIDFTDHLWDPSRELANEPSAMAQT